MLSRVSHRDRRTVRPADQDRALHPGRVDDSPTASRCAARIIARFAPAPPAVILDVGGAGGAYALWLAAPGQRVQLLDPVARLVRTAQDRRVSGGHPLSAAEVGDARHLPVPDRAADRVLSLGPLLHLPDRPDRARAIADAARALRPGGVPIAACVTRWESLFDGITLDLLADPTFAEIVGRDLEAGQYRDPTGHPRYFATTFFHALRIWRRSPPPRGSSS
jgi:ubiquinone/menaquinone biosynthesis C-methylase UbiE